MVASEWIERQESGVVIGVILRYGRVSDSEVPRWIIPRNVPETPLKVAVIGFCAPFPSTNATDISAVTPVLIIRKRYLRRLTESFG